MAGLSKSIAKEKYHQANIAQHAPMAAPTSHKASVHAMINKLNNASVANPGAPTQPLTLKKSASTRHVVNLLDLQQQQQINFYGAPGTATPSKKLSSQASQQLLGKQSAISGKHQVSLAATQKVASSGAAASSSNSNYKSLSKKQKNTSKV